MKDQSKPIEERGGWKVLSKEKIYSNPWIELEEHQVINPGGGPGIYGVVHYHNIAVSVIPVDEQGNTWFVGQHRYPLDVYSWEIPSGGGALDTDPIESGRRELKEETGIVARDWKLIQRFDLSNSTSDEYGLVYLATGLTFEEAEPCEDEDLKIRKLSLEQAFQEIQDGLIHDSLTVVGLLKLENMMLKGFWEPGQSAADV